MNIGFKAEMFMRFLIIIINKRVNEERRLIMKRELEQSQFWLF